MGATRRHRPDQRKCRECLNSPTPAETSKGKLRANPGSSRIDPLTLSPAPAPRPSSRSGQHPPPDALRCRPSDQARRPTPLGDTLQPRQSAPLTVNHPDAGHVVAGARARYGAMEVRATLAPDQRADNTRKLPFFRPGATSGRRSRLAPIPHKEHRLPTPPRSSRRLCADTLWSRHPLCFPA